MFWRRDERVEACSRDKRWVDFHRACGRCGLFFDDIDPVNDKGDRDVTERMRSRGYQAVAFRADRDPRGFYIQRFVSRGRGAGPVEAVLDAYRAAIAAGDSVEHGLDGLFVEALPTPDLAPVAAVIAATETDIGIDIDGLIG